MISIFLILAFFVFEISLHRVRLRRMSEEIQEALGKRDALITTLRHEIIDRSAHAAEKFMQSVAIKRTVIIEGLDADGNAVAEEVEIAGWLSQLRAQVDVLRSELDDALVKIKYLSKKERGNENPPYTFPPGR